MYFEMEFMVCLSTSTVRAAAVIKSRDEILETCMSFKEYSQFIVSNMARKRCLVVINEKKINPKCPSLG